MDKKVFITGGSRGIGAAAVKKFTDEGDEVFFIYKEQDEAAKKVMDETGAIGIRCDVRNQDAVKNAVKQAKIYMGTSCFDVIVCNAGISSIGMLDSYDLASDRDIMETNYGGTLNVFRAVYDDLVREKKGSIVCLSSMWGLRGASLEIIYSASKAAIIGLTRSLALELAPSGVRVNAVAPGAVNTDMCRTISPDREEADPEKVKAVQEMIPMGRIGEPEEIAEVIYFLASEKASYITGQVISADGGFTA